MGHGNGKATQPARVSGERLYPFPDQDLGIRGADTPVVLRHLHRYVEACAAARRNGVKDRADWLDVACGAGYGLSVVAETEPASYTGVDISEEAIRYARRHFGHHGRATFIQRDVTEWTPDRGYGAVLCIETLEHLPGGEQAPLIWKLREHLKPGGVIVLSCPAGIGSPSANPFHLHEPTLDEIAGYLGETFREMHVEMVDGTFGRFRQCYAVGVR